MFDIGGITKYYKETNQAIELLSIPVGRVWQFGNCVACPYCHKQLS
jgi:hypothetical protein